jgi:hypothetical protein
LSPEKQASARPRWSTPSRAILLSIGPYASAEDTAQRTRDESYLAEIYRVKGELAGDEACFERSLKIARQQQAKSWELRTATSMAQFYKRQGKREEARALLAPIYNSFTEGFDTTDLREAKVLLDQL